MRQLTQLHKRLRLTVHQVTIIDWLYEKRSPLKYEHTPAIKDLVNRGIVYLTDGNLTLSSNVWEWLQFDTGLPLSTTTLSYYRTLERVIEQYK